MVQQDHNEGLRNNFVLPKFDQHLKLWSGETKVHLMKWFGGTIILIMVQQNHSEGLRNHFVVSKSNIMVW
jgi:hypothetical protein